MIYHHYRDTFSTFNLQLDILNHGAIGGGLSMHLYAPPKLLTADY